MGHNYCGEDPEKIVAVNFGCSGLFRLRFRFEGESSSLTSGREASLSECPHAVGDDIYCVHEEDVVVACEGDGDPSGVGAFRKEEAVVQKKRFLLSFHLTCFDNLQTKPGFGGPPGTMRLVVCPQNCGQVQFRCILSQLREATFVFSSAGGPVKGVFIYTGDSAVSWSAQVIIRKVQDLCTSDMPSCSTQRGNHTRRRRGFGGCCSSTKALLGSGEPRYLERGKWPVSNSL